MKPQIVFAIMIADQVYASHGQLEMWLTSVDDSTHSHGSRHYSGLAIDIRTKDIPGGSLGNKARAIHATLKSRLDKEYDVILESDHIHVEYDPG